MALLSCATDGHPGRAPNNERRRAHGSDRRPSARRVYRYSYIGLSLNGTIDALLQILGPNPKMIVLRTDGVPTSHNGRFYGFNHPIPVQAALKAAENAKDEGIPIYDISYGDGTDPDLMDDLAETSEGKAYYAPDEDSLNVVYTEIAVTA